MYLYIPLEATVESLRVASYDAGRALRATKSIIAFLCEIGYFANCVFSGVRTPLFLVFTNPGKIVQPAGLARTICISQETFSDFFFDPVQPDVRASSASPCVTVMRGTRLLDFEK